MANQNQQFSIQDLESLLRKKMGNDLIVENQTALNLLPPGENYGSVILKVDAVIRRSKESKESEKLHLIAKTPLPDPKMRVMIDIPFLFEKESFMYETILPMYNKLERDCGVSEDDVFDVGAEFYGSRLSLESDEVFDDNAVILLENLIVRGYYNGNRITGLDLNHSRLAVIAMAKFHALGIGIKIKNPELFETLKIRSKCMDMKNITEMFGSMIDSFKFMETDPVIGQYYHKFESFMNVADIEHFWLAVPPEPWSTIIHSDFWNNNIMFHRNVKTGLPDDVKLVDFQNYLFLNPLRELTFFLGASVDQEVGANNIDELIDLYYDTIIERLKIMGCDTEPYARATFDEQIIENACIEFGHSAFMLKILTRQVDESEINDPNATDLTSVLINAGSEMFYIRIRNLVKGYIKRGWF